MKSRKAVIQSIYIKIIRNKEFKVHSLHYLKEYFKQYSAVCTEFHEKSYKFTVPAREESQNKIINVREELKDGFERLIGLRKSLGNQSSRIEKFISSKTLPDL